MSEASKEFKTVKDLGFREGDTLMERGSIARITEASKDGTVRMKFIEGPRKGDTCNMGGAAPATGLRKLSPD